MRIRGLRTPGVALLGSVIALGLLASTAVATQQDGPRRKFRSGGDITIAAGQTVGHDLYLSGNTVQIDGRIAGDLTVAARTLIINGSIAGDLLAAAGEITVTGMVEGDVRSASARLTVQGRVEKDVLAAVRTLDVEQSGRIGGDLIYAAVEADLQGTVEGGVLSESRELPVGALGWGDAALAPAAGVTGVSPTIQRQEIAARDNGSRTGDLVRRFFLRFFAVFLVGLLLLVIASRSSWNAAALVRQRPLGSLGVGLATMGVLLLLIIAFAVTVFDLAISRNSLGAEIVVVVLAAFALLGGGVVMFVLLVVTTLTGLAIISLAAGRLILARGETTTGRRYLALLLGALIVSLLTALPVVGALLLLLATVFGLGAIILSLRRRPVIEAGGS